MLEQSVVEKILSGFLSVNIYPFSKFFTMMLRSKASLDKIMEAIGESKDRQ